MVTVQPQQAASASAGPPTESAINAQMAALGQLYNKADTAFISRSTSMLKQLPRSRLCWILEKLDPEMDAGPTSLLSPKGLVQLLWLYTKLWPSTPISKLGHLVSIIFFR